MIYDKTQLDRVNDDFADIEAGRVDARRVFDLSAATGYRTTATDACVRKDG